MAEIVDNKRGHRTLEEKLAKFAGKNRMGLDELVILLAAKVPEQKLSKKDTRAILDAFIEIVTESLHAGRTVVFPGFGSFIVKERVARRVRNPRENSGPKAWKEVGPSTVFRFKPGSNMKPVFHA